MNVFLVRKIKKVSWTAPLHTTEATKYLGYKNKFLKAFGKKYCCIYCFDGTVS